MKAAVFLDRDNTIIHNDGDLGDPELVRLIQGAASAIASLRGLNYKIIIITNQGGVARGKYGEADVEKTNQRVADLVKAASGANIDRFYYCPYHPNGSVPEYTCEHEWRKPQPGMLLQAAKDMNIDLSKSWMVGDQMRDVQAGVAAGTRCILLREDAQELQPLRGDQLRSGHIETTGNISHFTAHNMVEAVRIIAKQRKPEAEQASESTRKKWDPAAVKSARENLNPSAESSTYQRQSNEAKPTGSTSSNKANESDAAANQVAHPARKTTPKPFKPWGAKDSPASASSAQPVGVPAVKAGATPKAKPPEEKPATELHENEVPIAIDTFDPSLEPHEIQAMVQEDELQQDTTPHGSAVTAAAKNDASLATGRAEVGAAGGVTTHEATTREPTTQGTEDANAKPGARSRTPSSDVTLRQILQELRGQRTVQNDFSYVRMIAIVLQIVTVFLLLAGLLLGSTDVDIFLRWIATAILVQLAAIALLLLER